VGAPARRAPPDGGAGGAGRRHLGAHQIQDAGSPAKIECPPPGSAYPGARARDHTDRGAKSGCHRSHHIGDRLGADVGGGGSTCMGTGRSACIRGRRRADIGDDRAARIGPGRADMGHDRSAGAGDDRRCGSDIGAGVGSGGGFGRRRDAGSGGERVVRSGGDRDGDLGRNARTRLARDANFGSRRRARGRSPGGAAGTARSDHPDAGGDAEDGRDCATGRGHTPEAATLARICDPDDARGRGSGRTSRGVEVCARACPARLAAV